MHHDWVKKAKEDWNARAEDWHNKSLTMWTSGSRKAVAPTIRKHLAKPSTVLDIGCGDGTGSALIAKEGYHVTGTDLSSNMIQLAKKHENNRVEFMEGSLDQLLFRAHSFDACLCVNSLEWMQDPYREMAHIDRLVKPGGMIFCAILGPAAGPRSNSFDRLLGEPAICNTMMPWEFQGLCRKMGWVYIDEVHVYKDKAEALDKKSLSNQLKQALTFFTLFVYQTKK
ncbi:class I SAM-dependent methyltransferase [Jeotgalibacillus proteolyticus]|uniref:SAM-dependent methyltransferase n=1 Tax=Jeotgalibacillus proteolyticus TaxID=2082395 RepID=A0A2S5GDW8_9BACL|nr:class I SAM-dependent methyltransferase [Jeotgalibacillus proteolyticus]PPA71210.1 SAM-dependent methyltransferase [Jeotgalibacillus proteolyticus]